MQVIVCCNERQKEELLSVGPQQESGVFYIADINDIARSTGGGVILDLLFVHDEKRISLLKQSGHTVIINSVVHTVEEIDPCFVRINAWPTFLSSALTEAACLHNEIKERATLALQRLNRQTEWLPDEPGFITPRVTCMIINEAYFALSEGVSTKEEMDLATKLGTAYPYGPFAWAEKIGLDKIVDLLSRLGRTESRYIPSELLLQEAQNRKMTIR